MPAVATDALRVLFIDDEQAILDGILRMLRRLKPGWTTHGVASPLDALGVYKKHMASLDVVVCDINMPQISGLQILQAVYEHTPQMGRIALTGQLDIKTMIGTNKYADCHICKPVDIDVLCEKIIQVHLSRH